MSTIINDVDNNISNNITDILYGGCSNLTHDELHVTCYMFSKFLTFYQNFSSSTMQLPKCEMCKYSDLKDFILLQHYMIWSQLY